MFFVFSVKPRVKLSEDVNINQNVMYTAVGKREQVKCLVESYPTPRMSLLFNDELIPQQSYSFEPSKQVKGQVGTRLLPIVPIDFHFLNSFSFS
jgi:hypothetical protein